MKKFCLNIIMIVVLIGICQNTYAQLAIELKTKDLSKAKNIITDKSELKDIELYKALVKENKKEMIQTTNEDNNKLRFTFLSKEEEAELSQNVVSRNWFKVSVLPINTITLSIGFVTAF